MWCESQDSAGLILRGGGHIFDLDYRDPLLSSLTKGDSILTDSL
jgi:hypothetical protein